MPLPSNTALDSIFNPVTGLGARGGKEVTFDVQADRVLQYHTLANIMRSTASARRAITLPVMDAMSKGYTIYGSNTQPVDEDAAEKWEAEQDRLNIDRKVIEACLWGRAFGGGYLVFVTRDGNQIDKPLNLDGLKAIDQILVCDANECQPDKLTVLPSGTDGRTEIGSPVHYRVSLPLASREQIGKVPAKWARALVGQQKVHHTRIVKFLGNTITREQRLAHWAESDSLIQAFFRELAQLVGMPAAAYLLASEMKQDAIRIPALESVATSDAAEEWDERMRLLSIGKSLVNMIVLGRDEEFITRNGNVTGFKDLREAIERAAMAAYGIPMAIYYGESSTGLSGEAGIESDTYLSLLENEWTIRLGPGYRRIYKLVRAQKRGPFAGKYSGRWKIEPNPLRPETKRDRAGRMLTLAQLDTIYYAGGNGIFPREYLQQRMMGPDGWQERLPPFDPKDYPDWPPPMPVESSGGSTPNPEGKNAPGQLPPDPAANVDPTPATGAVGEDPRAPDQNTGKQNGDALVESFAAILDAIKASPQARDAAIKYLRAEA